MKTENTYFNIVRFRIEFGELRWIVSPFFICAGFFYGGGIWMDG